jgi:two-component system sensor histidine kinase CpxA
MLVLKRINPAQSLFLRVFLWFILAIFLVSAASIFLVRALDSGAKYRPVKPEQKRELNQLTRKFQTQINKGRHESLSRLAQQFSKRSRARIVLVDPVENTLVSASNRRITPIEPLLVEFAIDSPVIALYARGMRFVGPSTVMENGKTYLLFESHPVPGGFQRLIREEYPGLFIALFILVSAGVCYLLVRSLLKPITQLQKASKAMASGDLTARVGSASERSDQIGQLGRDFNLMAEKVELLVNGQKRLLGDISHELRSPLARLQLSIGIALQHAQNSDEQDTSALVRIEKEANQIEAMIAQVLMLSRLDSGQAVLSLQLITLDEVLQPIIEDAKFEAEQKSKSLIYNKQNGLTDLRLYVDPQLFSSALENIIRNAIHYCQGQVLVEVTQEENGLVFKIKDDGSGMEETQLARIFEPFYRASNARDRNSGGVGLGLAIASRAIAQHQGKLSAKNRKVGGLEVNLTLPLNLEEDMA